MSVRSLKFLLALISLTALHAGDLAEQNSVTSITIQTSVDRNRCTIGDLLTYSVVVSHGDSVQVEMPGLGANLGSFEIRDYRVHENRRRDGLNYTRVDYVISTFMTGEYEIPSLSVPYFAGADTVQRVLRTDKIKITVESVKPSEAGDILDVKPPLEIPGNIWLLLRWVGLGVFIVVLIISAFIIHRRRKAGKGLLSVRETPSRPPHEVALEALDKLSASEMLQRGEVKKFYTELSEIIRGYIGGRYFVVAMEMTTTEILNGLQNGDLEKDIYEAFRSFLFKCDMVKFAKYIPSGKENETIVPAAYDLVNSTSVVFEMKDSE